jgi:hypothetical protein
MTDYAISIEPGTIFISPFGFHNLARDFLRDARLSKSAGSTRVTWFLYCHSLELGLKAFLKAHHATDKELRDVGHNLERAHTRAKEIGLDSLVAFSADDLAELAKANEKHSSKGGFRYFDLWDCVRGDGAHVEWPDLNVIDDVVARLLDSIRTFCKSVA